jgi:hypothetical protein
MIYSLNNQCQKTKVAITHVPQEILSHWNSRFEKCDYYYLQDNSEYWTIGFLKVEDTYCAIDFTSTLSDGFKAIKLFLTVIEEYQNVYAIPNDDGKKIWSSLKFKSATLYLTFGWRRAAYKYCYKSIRYLYLNHWFKLTIKKGVVKLKREIFYRGKLPSTIYLDTF